MKKLVSLVLVMTLLFSVASTGVISISAAEVDSEPISANGVTFLSDEMADEFAKLFYSEDKEVAEEVKDILKGKKDGTFDQIKDIIDNSADIFGLFDKDTLAEFSGKVAALAVDDVSYLLDTVSSVLSIYTNAKSFVTSKSAVQKTIDGLQVFVQIVKLAGYSSYIPSGTTAVLASVEMALALGSYLEQAYFKDHAAMYEMTLIIEYNTGQEFTVGTAPRVNPFTTLTQEEADSIYQHLYLKYVFKRILISLGVSMDDYNLNEVLAEHPSEPDSTDPESSEPSTQPTEPLPDIDETHYGNIGDCSWYLNTKVGTLYILGNGAMASYSSASSYPWYSYRGYIKRIIVVNGVTRIGKEAFKNCISVESIELPKSLNSIGYSAFELTNPKKLILPFIGRSRTPDNSIYEGYLNSIFTYNPLNTDNLPTNLEEVVVTDAKSIPNDAFRFMTSVRKVTLNDEIESIGTSAFSGLTKLSEINIPDAITIIGTYAFRGCKALISIDFPNSLVQIGNYSFENCTSLEAVILNEGLLNIDSYAFKGCESVSNVKFPSSLQEIGDNAFEGCISFKEISIPEGITRIGKEAFKNCISVESIELPKSLNSIGYSAFELTNPKKLILPFIGRSRTPDNSIYEGYLNSIFTYNPLNTDNLPTNLEEVVVTDAKSIPNDAFRFMTSVRKVTLNDEIESIGTSAFSGLAKLSEINIPDAITIIGTSAFYNCKALGEIVIPNSTFTIESNAFYNCSELKKAYYYGDDISSISLSNTGNESLLRILKRVIIGDTNLDGVISIRDVTAIQRYLVELETFADEQIDIADTNADGEINISDATHLQMFLAEYDGIVLEKS